MLRDSGPMVVKCPFECYWWYLLVDEGDLWWGVPILGGNLPSTETARWNTAWVICTNHFHFCHLTLTCSHGRNATMVSSNIHRYSHSRQCTAFHLRSKYCIYRTHPGHIDYLKVGQRILPVGVSQPQVVTARWLCRTTWSWRRLSGLIARSKTLISAIW